MNKKQMVGVELKEKVAKKENIVQIGIWAYEVYLSYDITDDLNFNELLLELNAMELGPDFAISYEKLNKIADDLIAGMDVNLDNYRHLK